MRALVTGSGGFVGRHLAAHLLAEGDEVVLTGRADTLNALAHEFPAAAVAPLDVRDGAELAAALETHRPDVVYHLAAITFIPEVERSPGTAYEVNVLGTLRVFEAAAARAPRTKVLFVSTGHLYAPSTVPIPESGPIESGSFYGLTKRHGEELAAAFARRGVPTVIARPFNHSGPGQAPSFVLPSFARQIAEAEAGQREPSLFVGNLSAVRDFLDVRDVVRAYRALARLGGLGEVYNIASGEGRSIREALDALVALSRVRVAVEVDPSRLRAADTLAIVGDASKLRSATGWKPTIPFDRTLGDLLAEARAAVGGA